MIKLWLAQRPAFLIPNETQRRQSTGSIKLLNMIWYKGIGDLYNIRVNTHLLDKGYKV